MNSDVLRAVQRFTRDELLGQEVLLDSLADPPLPLIKRFADGGLMNWWLPQHYGTAGLGLVDSVEIVNTLAYGDAGTAFTLFLPVLATSAISLYGSAELRETYLARLATERGFAAMLGSEHDAGSELHRTATTARREGDSIVLDGAKAYSTNTGFAQVLVVVARDADRADEFVAVVVPADTAGLDIRRRWDVIGLRSSATYEVDLRGVRVPAANVLNGNGLRLLEVGLNASRILIAVTGLGIARRIRDEAMTYARTKSVRNQPLTGNAVFAGRLGQIEMQIEVMYQQCLAAAREYDEILSAPDAAARFVRTGTMKSAVVAKMLCGQVGWQIASQASEMFGGLGYTNEHVIGKLVRDMRFVSLIEGGDDVLRDLLYSRNVMSAGKRR